MKTTAADLALVVADRMRALVAPLLTRLEALETRTAGTLEELRGRLADRAALDELRTRLDALELREGPPGPPGPPGRDGLDGKDGTAGLRYCGVYAAGTAYAPGDIVTAGGSAWHCQNPTMRPPAASPDWILMVKSGKDYGRRDRG